MPTELLGIVYQDDCVTGVDILGFDQWDCNRIEGWCIEINIEAVNLIICLDVEFFGFIDFFHRLENDIKVMIRC